MHRFIVNTENVNEYGYRILTEGIDTTQYEKNPVVLYLHNRNLHKPDGNEVIGRAVKLEKKDGVLYADIEFDKEDEFAAKIAGKVERGFVRMASMYADVKATSMNESDILPGQQYETVTKCKLVEISIVDIGGNDDAIKLSRNSAEHLKLAKLPTKQTTRDMSIKTIALGLGLSESSTEEQILSEFQKVKLGKEQAEAKVAELESRIKANETKEAKSLVDEAVQLGLIPEGLKDTMVSAFENDFENQKVKLSAMISEKREELVKQDKHQAVTNIVLGGQANNGKAVADTEESFDYLSKKNPVKLAKIRTEDPVRYQELVKGYAEGVRYVENKN